MVSYQTALHVCSAISNISAMFLKNLYKKRQIFNDRVIWATHNLLFSFTNAYCFIQFLYRNSLVHFSVSTRLVYNSILTPVLIKVPLFGSGLSLAGLAGSSGAGAWACWCTLGSTADPTPLSATFGWFPRCAANSQSYLCPVSIWAVFFVSRLGFKNN